jgi:hypothetical protein
MPSKLVIGTVFSVLAIAVGGVWFATEWAAWHLAFQPQLGAPLFGRPHAVRRILSGTVTPKRRFESETPISAIWTEASGLREASDPF